MRNMPMATRWGTIFERSRTAETMSIGTCVSRASTLAVPPGIIPNGTAAMEHAGGYFVDGAVAARGENEVATSLNLLLGLRGSAPRSGGGHQIRFYALALKSVDGTLEQMLAA